MAQSKLDSFFTRPAPKRKKGQETDLSAVCFAESESSFRSHDISCEIEELEETEEFR